MKTVKPCFITLWDKPTVFENIYQNLNVSVVEQEENDFLIRISCSYGAATFEDESGAASTLSEYMSVKDHYFKLRSSVNQACNLIRDYSSVSDSDFVNKKNEAMLFCLNNFANYLRHYEKESKV